MVPKKLGQGPFGVGVGLMGDDDNVAVAELLWRRPLVRMVSHGNPSPDIVVDLGHHLVSLSLEACHDHYAYRLHTRLEGCVQLSLET